MAFLVDAASELLARSHQQGRLAHAYLLTGPEGSGKKLLALRLMNLVSGHDNSSIEQAAGEHVQLVRPESKSRRIRVDGMRLMERRLHLAVPKGVTKVALVFDADRMMPEAANAFLKTLEEPPKQSLLLLLTAQPEQLLDTVRSRCIRVPLYRPGAVVRTKGDELLLAALSEHFQQHGSGSLSGALSFMQSFIAILRMEKETISKKNAELLKAESMAYSQTTDGDWLKRREDFYKARTEADYLQRRNALVQVLVDWFGDAIRQQCGFERLDLEACAASSKATGEAIELRDLLRRLDALEDLRTNLNTNIQETLALEAGFLAAFGG
ncbi:MAG: DNA polymerase-3 subunit delta' [Verrucomicrobiales bacterium]|jgi:DNA polymerase-3 subunit delta'